MQEWNVSNKNIPGCLGGEKMTKILVEYLNFTIQNIFLLFQVPMNTHFIESYEGGGCPYLDQCVLHNHDANDVLEWLQEDFSRYYEQNKAPYMMAFHTNWFQIKALEDGLHKFLEWATSL